jgi:hypothetical protein
MKPHVYAVLRNQLMASINPPLDAKGQKLLKRAQQLLDEMLAANTGTALSVAHPRLVETVNELAMHRYAQIGIMEPQAAKH